MNPQISLSKVALAAFYQTYGIKRLAIFGSALREDFGSESDIDVLVEFEPGRMAYQRRRTPYRSKSDSFEMKTRLRASAWARPNARRAS